MGSVGSRIGTRFALLFVVAAAGAALLAACGSSGGGGASGSPSASPSNSASAAPAATRRQVVDLVDLTGAAVEKDARGTFAAIDAGRAPYVDPSDPSRYAFVYDTSVTLVSTPDAAVRGANMSGKPDAAGKDFRDEIVNGALQHGSGWEDYLYTQPDQKGLFTKSTYYKLFTGSDDRTYIVCSGRYLGPAKPAAQSGSSAPAPTTAEVQAFVEKAVAFARTQGKAKALAAFTAPGGEFHAGGLYVFAYDFKGTVIAHGGDPSLVGKDLLGMHDPDGLPVIRELVRLARGGSGWLAYQWANPANGGKVEPKLGYVQKVDDGWFLGSGTYGTAASATTDAITPADVVAFVERAAAYVETHGKKAALKEFSDPHGSFRDGELYIFAEDFGGKELASGGQPGLVGKNILNVQDANGVYLVRKLIATAKHKGRGWVRYVWDNPETGTQQPKRAYVIKAGPDWYVGSGMYVR